MNTDETNFDVLKTQENVIEQTKKIIKQYDVVNNPSHYTDSKIEVIDYNDFMNIISTYYNQYLPTENTVYTIEISIKE